MTEMAKKLKVQARNFLKLDNLMTVYRLEGYALLKKQTFIKLLAANRIGLILKLTYAYWVINGLNEE